MKTTLTISRKLWLMTTMLVANVAAVGLVAAWNTAALTRHLHVEADINLPAVRAMTLVDMRHDGIRGTVLSSFVESEGSQGADYAKIEKEFEEYATDIGVQLDVIAGLEIDQTTAAAVKGSRPAVDGYLVRGREVIQLVKTGRRAQALELLPKFTAAFELLEGDLEKLGDLIMADTHAGKQLAADLARRSEILNFALIAFGVIVGLLSALFVIRGLSRSLAEMTQGLTADAKELANAAGSLNAASETLGQATTQQSSAIEESAAAMEEISSMVAQTSQVAQDTQRKADAARDDAARGREVVQRMVHAMEEISASNERLQGIVKVIGDIESRTRVINDIAFETRLLAFNASIEAARAGVHGRGFAVVAEEVGKLAETSNKSADEVRKLLDESLAQVGEIVRDTRGKVEAGQHTSRDCAAAFGVIETTFQAIADAVATIAGAAREQSTGITQTNQAMTEMDRTTHANSRSAERLASEAGRLTLMAGTLDASAGRFHTLVFGKTRRATDVSSAAGAEWVPDVEPAAARTSDSRRASSSATKKAAKDSAIKSRDRHDAEASSGGSADAPDPQSNVPPEAATVSRKDSRWRAA